MKEKQVLSNEIENQNKYRRSIVAAKNIEKDQTITLDMLGVKRPGTGLLPREMSKVNGLKAKIKIQKDTIIVKGLLY